jgi:hypothetical protein
MGVERKLRFSNDSEVEEEYLEYIGNFEND